MSSINNRVFQVLVTEGDKNILAKGNFAEALTPGQLGVFDAETGKSIDATTTVKPKKVYFAVGVDTDGNGTSDKIISSTNEYIETSRITYAKRKMGQTPVKQEITITDYKNCCDGEEKNYVLKVHLENEQILRTIGMVPFTKTFVASPNCGEDCTSLDINEITKQLVDAINKDTSGFFHAVPIDEAGAEIADLDAYIATHKAANTDNDTTNDVGSGIKLIADPVGIQKYCAINLKYYKPRGTKMVVTANGAFECCGTKVTETVEIKYGSGSGYDVQQLEYIANGWNGNLNSTIRVSAITGLPIQEGDYLAKKNTLYDYFILENEVGLPGITIQMPGYNKTIIAVPNTDDNTGDDLETIFELLGFSM